MWKTNNEIVEGKYSVCQKFTQFEYFYKLPHKLVVEGHSISKYIYDTEKLPQNGFEDLNLIMTFWKDNSKL